MLNNINQMMDAWRHHQWYIDGYGCDFNEFEQDSDDDRIPRNIPPSKQCKIEEWTKWNQCGCNGYCLVHFNELEKGSNDHRKPPSRKCKIKKCNKWNQKDVMGTVWHITMSSGRAVVMKRLTVMTMIRPFKSCSHILGSGGGGLERGRPHTNTNTIYSQETQIMCWAVPKQLYTWFKQWSIPKRSYMWFK